MWSGPAIMPYHTYLLMGFGPVPSIMHYAYIYIYIYHMESRFLKYFEKVEPDSKIPIERISGLENTCKTYFRPL